MDDAGESLTAIALPNVQNGRTAVVGCDNTGKGEIAAKGPLEI
jgi:hypothetical protein